MTGRATQVDDVKALGRELLRTLSTHRPAPAQGVAALLTTAAVVLACAHPDPDQRLATARRAAAAWLDMVMEDA